MHQPAKKPETSGNRERFTTAKELGPAPDAVIERIAHLLRGFTKQEKGNVAPRF